MQWLLTKPENAFIYNNCSLFNEAQIKLFGTCKKYGVIVIDKQACLTLSLSLSLSLSFSLSNTHFLSPFLFWMTDRSWSTYQLKVNAKKIYLIMHLCTTHVVLFQGLGNQVKNGLVIFKNKVHICTRKRFGLCIISMNITKVIKALTPLTFHWNVHNRQFMLKRTVNNVPVRLL